MSKYQIIYADPPWSYKNPPSHKGTTRVFAKNHYDLVSTAQLAKLPIADITAKDAVCLLWATFPMLPDALELMTAWGFKYRTVAFAWIKQNKKQPTPFWGGGYYTRSNAEIVLLGIKGKILPRQSRSVHQLIQTPVQAHSQKPAIVRDKIVELFGDLPRIELFAREKSEGWDVWGNEVENSIELLEQETL